MVMGVLYYIAKTDGSRELFALNKVYQYDLEGAFARLQGEPLQAVFENESVLSGALDSAFRRHRPDSDHKEGHASCYRRIAARLFRWAGSAPLRFMSEFEQDDEFHAGLDYEQQRALITGSAHDSDYEEDGVTYKPGSAW